MLRGSTGTQTLTVIHKKSFSLSHTHMHVHTLTHTHTHAHLCFYDNCCGEGGGEKKNRKRRAIISSLIKIKAWLWDGAGRERKMGGREAGRWREGRKGRGERESLPMHKSKGSLHQATWMIGETFSMRREKLIEQLSENFQKNNATSSKLSVYVNNGHSVTSCFSIWTKPNNSKHLKECNHMCGWLAYCWQ